MWDSEHLKKFCLHCSSPPPLLLSQSFLFYPSHPWRTAAVSWQPGRLPFLTLPVDFSTHTLHPPHQHTSCICQALSGCCSEMNTTESNLGFCSILWWVLYQSSTPHLQHFEKKTVTFYQQSVTLACEKQCDISDTSVQTEIPGSGIDPDRAAQSSLSDCQQGEIGILSTFNILFPHYIVASRGNQYSDHPTYGSKVKTWSECFWISMYCTWCSFPAEKCAKSDRAELMHLMTFCTWTKELICYDVDEDSHSSWSYS